MFSGWGMRAIGLAGRRSSPARTAAAEARGSAEVRRLDLADLAFAQEFAERWEGRPIDLLIASVGEMMLSEQRARDDFEMQFGTNHLGQVVTVSSGMHRAGYGAIRFDDLNLSWGYTPVRAYAQSKPAHLLFALELQRRLADAGSPVRALAAHPGCGDESAEPCRQSGGPVGRGARQPPLRAGRLGGRLADAVRRGPQLGEAVGADVAPAGAPV
jgi:NAD(P)-dependent dehydrogenase (short-subunit alcohol dehydrogenase family)